jgi:hypothetical protein
MAILVSHGDRLLGQVTAAFASEREREGSEVRERQSLLFGALRYQSDAFEISAEVPNPDLETPDSGDKMRRESHSIIVFITSVIAP